MAQKIDYKFSTNRLTSAFLLILFTVQNFLFIDNRHVAEAFNTKEPQSPSFFLPAVHQSLLEKIRLPENLGEVKSSFQGSRNKVVIHIQDAHVNEEAQRNIAGILDYFVRENNLKLVNLEGAEGELFTEYFSSFIDQEARQVMADYYLKEGRMTGAEYLTIVKHPKLLLHGVENMNLYRQNRKAYLKSVSKQGKIMNSFDKLFLLIDKVSRYVLSQDQLIFVRLEKEFAEDPSAIYSYVNFLIKAAGDNEVSVSGFQKIESFMKLSKLRESHDFTDVPELFVKIKGLFSPQLFPVLYEIISDYQNNLISKTDFLRLIELQLKELEKQTSDKQALEALIDQVSFAKMIDSLDSGIFREIDELSKLVSEKLFNDADSKKMLHMFKVVRLSQRMCEFNLNRSDADFYNQYNSDFSKSYLDENLIPLLKQFRFDSHWFKSWDWIDSALNEAENFYQLAFKRDHVLIENSLKQMNQYNETISAIVAGGFHTPGIENYLRKNNISYLVVAPTISRQIDQEAEAKMYQAAVADESTDAKKLLIKAGYLSDSKFQLVPEPLTPVKANKPRLSSQAAFELATLLSLFSLKGDLEAIIPPRLKGNPHIAEGLRPFEKTSYSEGAGYKFLARLEENGKLTVLTSLDRFEYQRKMTTALESLGNVPTVKLPTGKVIAVYPNVPVSAYQNVRNLKLRNSGEVFNPNRIEQILKRLKLINQAPKNLMQLGEELRGYENELNLLSSRSELRLSNETLAGLEEAKKQLASTLKTIQKLREERQEILDASVQLERKITGTAIYNDQALQQRNNSISETKAILRGKFLKDLAFNLSTFKDLKIAKAYLNKLRSDLIPGIPGEEDSQAILQEINLFLARIENLPPAVKNEPSVKLMRERISQQKLNVLTFIQSIQTFSQDVKRTEEALEDAIKRFDPKIVLRNHFLKLQDFLGLGAKLLRKVRKKPWILVPATLGSALTALFLTSNDNKLPLVQDDLPPPVSKPMLIGQHEYKPPEQQQRSVMGGYSPDVRVFPSVAHSMITPPIRNDLYPGKPRLGNPGGKNGFYESRLIALTGKPKSTEATFSNTAIGTGTTVFTKIFTLEELTETKKNGEKEIVRKNPLLLIVADPQKDGFNVIYKEAALLWENLGPLGLQVVLIISEGGNNRALAMEKHLQFGERVPVVYDSHGIWKNTGIGFYRPGHGWMNGRYTEHFPKWNHIIQVLQNWQNESPSTNDRPVVSKGLRAETISHLAQNEFSLEQLIAVLHSDPNASRQLWKPSSAREEQFSMIHEDLKGLPDKFSTEFGMIETYLVEYCRKMELPFDDKDFFYPLDWYLFVFKPFFILKQYDENQATAFMKELVSIAEDERKKLSYPSPIPDNMRQWFESQLRQYRRLVVQSLTRTPRNLDPRYKGNWKIWAMKSMEEEWLKSETNQRSGVSLWYLVGSQFEKASEGDNKLTRSSSIHDRALENEIRYIRLTNAPVPAGDGVTRRVNAWKAVYDPASYPGLPNYSSDLEIMMVLYHDEKDNNLYRHPSILKIDKALVELTRIMGARTSARAGRNQSQTASSALNWDAKKAMEELAKVPGFKEWFGASFNPEEARLRATDFKFRQRSIRLQKFLADMKYTDLFLEWIRKLQVIWPNTFAEGKIRSGQPETVRIFAKNFDRLLNVKPKEFKPKELEDLQQIAKYEIRGLDLSFYGHSEWYDPTSSDKTKLGVRQVSEPVAPMSPEYLLRGMTAQQLESLTRLVSEEIANQFPVPPFTLALEDPKMVAVRDKNPVLPPVIAGPLETLSARGYIYTNFGISRGTASIANTNNDFRQAILLNPDAMWQSGLSASSFPEVVDKDKIRKLVSDFKFLSEKDYFKNLYEEDYGPTLIEFIKLLSLGRISERIRFSPQGYVVYGFDYLQKVEDEVINALLTEEGKKLLLDGKSNEVSRKHFKDTFPSELGNYLWGVVQTKPVKKHTKTSGPLGFEASYQLRLAEYYNDFSAAAIELKNIYYPTIFAFIFSARSEGIDDLDDFIRWAKLEVYLESRVAIRKAVEDFYEGQGAKGFSLINPENVGRLSGLAERVRDGVPPEVLATALEIAADETIRKEALELYNLLNEFEGEEKLTALRVFWENETKAGNETAFLLWWASKRIDEKDFEKWATVLRNKVLMKEIKTLGDAFWDINGAFLDEKPSSSFTQGKYSDWDRKKKGMFSSFLELAIEQSFDQIQTDITRAHQYFSNLKPADREKLIKNIKRDALWLLYGVTLDQKWNPENKGEFDFYDLQTSLIQKGFLSSWAIHHLNKYSKASESTTPRFEWDGYISAKLLADKDARKQIFELTVQRFNVRLIYLNPTNPLPSKENLAAQREKIIEGALLNTPAEFDDLLPYLPQLNGILLSLSREHILNGEGDIIKNQLDESLRVLKEAVESEEDRALRPEFSRPNLPSSRSEVRHTTAEQKLNPRSFAFSEKLRDEQKMFQLLQNLDVQVDWRSVLSEFADTPESRKSFGIQVPTAKHAKNYLILEVNPKNGMTDQQRTVWAINSISALTKDSRFGKGLEVVVFLDPKVSNLANTLTQQFSPFIEKGFLRIEAKADQNTFIRTKVQELGLSREDVYHLLLDVEFSLLRRQVDIYALKGALGLARAVGICLVTDDLKSGNLDNGHFLKVSSLLDSALSKLHIDTSA